MDGGGRNFELVHGGSDFSHTLAVGVLWLDAVGSLTGNFTDMFPMAWGYLVDK